MALRLTKNSLTYVRSEREVFVARGISLLVCGASAFLAGCSILPASGPTAAAVREGANSVAVGQTKYALIEISNTVIEGMEQWRASSLQETFGQGGPPAAPLIGVGDSVQVVIWEAASGGLFSAPTIDRLGPGPRSAIIPEQAVDPRGNIWIPYAGAVLAAGRTPRQVEQQVVEGLRQKAIDPQALVTVTQNTSNTVTVLGEVTSGARIGLSGHGSRILEVIAMAGGIRVPAHEVSLTLMRDGKSVRMPMQALLTNPEENIYVRSGDVVTVARDPLTFTAFGATGRNAVLPFETMGISLEEAIGKAGGLDDQRADPTGVFVIRFEPADQYDQLGLSYPGPLKRSQVPVIYELDLRTPGAYFMARRFAMKNKDILFVSNSPITPLQKTIGLIQGIIVPAATSAVVVGTVKP